MKNLQALLLSCVLATGIYHVTSQFIFSRVVGGSTTTIERYPIIAQLLLDPWGTKNYVQHCAGVILTTRHIISTAHCFLQYQTARRNYTNPKFWKVKVGSSYRTRGGSIHYIKKIITHPSFEKFYYTNDIAIVVVASQLRLGPTVRQATITTPGSELKPNSLCLLLGWGSTEPSGPQADQLQQAIVYAVDQDVCRARYSTINAVISDSMLCAGRLDVGGVDGCMGDSGGPLVHKGLVVGLVSFGHSCGHPFYPGVYTKISQYTGWILETVAKNK